MTHHLPHQSRLGQYLRPGFTGYGDQVEAIHILNQATTYLTCRPNICCTAGTITESSSVSNSNEGRSLHNSKQQHWNHCRGKFLSWSMLCLLHKSTSDVPCCCTSYDAHEICRCAADTCTKFSTFMGMCDWACADNRWANCRQSALATPYGVCIKTHTKSETCSQMQRIRKDGNVHQRPSTLQYDEDYSASSSLK